MHGAVYSLRVFIPLLCLRGNVLATLTVHIACGTDITDAGVIVRPWYQARPSVLSCSPGIATSLPSSSRRERLALLHICGEQQGVGDQD